MMLPPWFKQDADWFGRLVDQDALPQVMLLEGDASMGCHALIEWMVARLLCEATEGAKPCGQCPGCQCLKAHTHSDYLMNTTSEQPYGIATVRDLLAALNKTPQRSVVRVCVLSDVHRFSTEAQNALLKSLEEPPPYVYFIGLVEDASRLLRTIRSRSHVWTLRRPDAAASLTWLKDHPVQSASAEAVVERLYPNGPMVDEPHWQVRLDARVQLEAPERMLDKQVPLSDLLHAWWAYAYEVITSHTLSEVQHAGLYEWLDQCWVPLQRSALKGLVLQPQAAAFYLHEQWQKALRGLPLGERN